MSYPVAEAAVAAVNVGKRYRLRGRTVTALDDVTIEALFGELTLISGPSGAGKSTLLRILGLVDDPDSGSVEWFGQGVPDKGDAARSFLRNEHTGFVFQDPRLIGYLSAAENVELPLAQRGFARDDRLKQASLLLDRLGMADRGSHYPHELSGGEQQRVALARALVTSPNIILADEPTSDLDADHAAVIRSALLDEARSSRCVVVVSHDPHFATDAQQRFDLRQGRLV